MSSYRIHAVFPAAIGVSEGRRGGSGGTGDSSVCGIKGVAGGVGYWASHRGVGSKSPNKWGGFGDRYIVIDKNIVNIFNFRSIVFSIVLATVMAMDIFHASAFDRMEGN